MLVVPSVFAKYHNYGSRGGVCWVWVGDELNALLGSRHASLYPPSRRRTFHDLPKLCGPPDVRQGRRAHWSMAKIDFTYACFDCGTEIRQTMIKPELLH